MATSDPGSRRPPIDPSTIIIKPRRHIGNVASILEAALRWFVFGLQVIGLLPAKKIPAVPWDPWLDGLSQKKILAHWAQHPDHDVGFIVGDDFLVLDADSPEAIAALEALEARFNVTPNMVVRTRRGVHHYFRRAPGTFAKTDSHDTALHPDRIDVKTGRSMVVLPPSGGRTLLSAPLKSAAELTEVGQDFIDAVFEHNGRPAPRQVELSPSPRTLTGGALDQQASELEALLAHIDPDCGYEDWLRVLMALRHETAGSDEGLRIADKWSSSGSKYRGPRELETKWRSFQSTPAIPFTIATLRRMVDAAGFDWIEVCAAVGPQFERIDAATNPADVQPVTPTPSPNPLARFSLRGRSDEVEKYVVAQEFLLGEVALMGQLTIFYAAPNSGKTLITIHLLIEAIKRGMVDPSNVYYVNVDDDGTGLLTKLRIAEEHGFHMLAEGYQDFAAHRFLDELRHLVNSDQARGIVVVLDTLKKSVDLMDKSKSSAFTRVARQFVTKGGTLIGLAHTNKNPGHDGKPVFAGTSDLRDDADCTYVLNQLAGLPGDTEKIVVFENTKRRGNVTREAAYSYSIEGGTSYHELLASIRPADPTQVTTLKEAETARTETELIAVVAACIEDGVNTKMKLADAIAQRAGVSRRTAVRTIEKFTGTDPALHRWDYTVGERGAKIFVVLDPAVTDVQGERDE